MFATNQKPVEIGGMRERSVHIVKFQNMNLSILTLKQFVPFIANLWNYNGSEGRDRGAEEPSLGSPFGGTC